MQRCTDDVSGVLQWNAAGLGITVDDDVMTHLAWADDTWTISSTTHGLKVMGDRGKEAEVATGWEIK